MKAISGVDHGFELVLVHGFGLEDNFKVLRQRLFGEIIVQEERLKNLTFANETNGVNISRWLVREQAIDKHSRFEAHELKDGSCHVTGDTL